MRSVWPTTDRFGHIDAQSGRLLETAIDRLGLSVRVYQRVLNIARTIADLDDRADLCTDHISEAIQYRSLDRQRRGF